MPFFAGVQGQKVGSLARRVNGGPQPRPISPPAGASSLYTSAPYCASKHRAVRAGQGMREVQDADTFENIVA